MSATIYSAPEEIKKPEFDFANFNAKKHQEKEDQYIKDLEQWLRKNGYNGKNVGKTIKFPVADSYAVYMVIEMKPLKLMHVPIGDEWHYDNVDLMTAKRVQEKIDANKRMEKLWKENAEKQAKKNKN